MRGNNRPTSVLTVMGPSISPLQCPPDSEFLLTGNKDFLAKENAAGCQQQQRHGDCQIALGLIEKSSEIGADDGTGDDGVVPKPDI